jgi:predicted transcriptional regulator
MMMTYRGYTLVPVMDGRNSQVSVFSRANFITKTMAFADEQSALTEARKVVDAILARRPYRTLPVGNSTGLPTARHEPQHL